MFAKVALLCLMAAVAVARPDKRPSVGYEYGAPQVSASSETHEGMPFDFSYAVKDDDSGLDFGHETNSDGKLTTGQYRIALPDGRTQIVTYTVDRLGGYQPTVEYEGEARFPETKSTDNRQYSAPSPGPQRPSSLYGAPQ